MWSGAFIILDLNQTQTAVEVSDFTPSNKKTAIRVLHVDDDFSMLEISKDILMEMGVFEIDLACSVDEAFKKMASGSYDIIISDYEMPNRDGLQFLKELREMNNEIPFVLFTGKGREEVAIRALNLGAEGYYNKQGSPETVYGELSHGIQQIVKRKKAETKLKESEYLTKKILHATPNLLYIYDLIEHRNIYANKEVLAFLGYTPEQIESMGPELFGNILHPDDVEIVDKHHARFVNAPDNEVFEIEYRMKHINGEWRWLRSRDIIFARTKEGFGKQILGSSEDITERKQTEQALVENEAKYRTLVDSLPEAIFDADIEGNIIFANARVFELTGYTKQDLRKSFKAFCLIPPEERLSARNTFVKVLAGNIEHRSDKLLVRKNGTTFLASMTSIPIIKNGKIVGARGIISDQTEQIKAEKALKKSNDCLKEAQSLAHLGSWEWNIKTNQETWSDELYRIYGFEPQTFLPTYDNFLKALHPEDRARVITAAKQAMKGKEPYNVECRIVRPTGEIRHLHCQSEIHRDSEGKPLRMVGTDLDITDRKKIENELQISLEREHFFANLIRNASIAIAVASPDGKVMMSNEAFQELTGYNEEELRKITWNTVLTPIEWQKHEAEQLEKIVASKKSGIYRKEYIRKNGTRVPIEIVVHPFFDDKGNVSHYFGFIKDITETKKIEEALIQSQASMRSIVDSTSDMIWSVSSDDFTLLEFNQSLKDYFLKHTGLEIKVGMHQEDLFADKRIAEKWGSYYRRVLRDGPFTTEYQTTYGPLAMQVSFNVLKKGDKVFGISAFGKDITESQKSQAELKQKNEALERVAESIGSGLALIGKDYSVVWANKHLMDLGVAPKKKCYQTFNSLETVCPDCGVKKIFEQNVPLDVHEYKTTNSKGETVWIELRVTPLKDKNGNITAALELAVPITERKKAEEALSKSEERYRSLADSLPEIVFEIDLNGRLTYANESAFQITGYTKTDFAKGVCVFDLVEKKDKERAKAHFTKTLADEPSTENEYTFVRKDGSKFQSIVVSKPIVVEGEAVGLRGLVVDITERKKAEDALKESEKRSRAIVANAPIGIATSGPDKHFLSANEAFCKILGYSENELHELTFKDLTYPADLKESAAKMGELERGFIPSFALEKRYVKKDGTLINGKVMVSAVPNQIGEPTLYIAELEDITERKKAEERQKALERKIKEYSEHLKYLVELKTVQLKDANERLVKSERLAAIGELAGMVGHDLRNPLTGIKNAAYYLKKKGATISEAQSKQMLDLIDDAITRSNKIINDLLDYSREMHLELIKYQAQTLVDEATRLVNVPSRIQIVNNVQDDVWIWVDSDKIVRVFINLIKNAIEAIPESGKIEISSCKTDQDVKIAFADNGTGISETTLEKLFLPLFTTKAQGMGFGLAICKRIVEALGGEISVETAEGKGTTFTITLPTKIKE